MDPVLKPNPSLINEEGKVISDIQNSFCGCVSSSLYYFALFNIGPWNIENSFPAIDTIRKIAHIVLSAGENTESKIFSRIIFVFRSQ